MAELILTGTVTGRSHANGPIDQLGNPVPHTHDRDVILTVTIYVPGHFPSDVRVWLDSLERGTLEIGDPVTVTIAAAKTTPAKAEPYSITPTEVA